MKKRVDRLKGLMEEKGFDVALLMHPRDVYYYAGTAQPCNLLVTLKEEPVLFVRRAWEFVKGETTLEDLRSGPGLGDINKYLSSLGLEKGVLGLEEDLLPARLYKRIGGYFSGFKSENIVPLVMEQRLVKDEEEIGLVRQAACLFQHVHDVVMNNLRPGITEVELAGLVWARIRQEGHEGFVAHRRWDGFLPGDGIVSSGENLWKISGYAMTVTGTGKSKAVPWGASDRVIQGGDLVLLDIGTNYRGYHGDVARTYVVGKADSRQKEVFGVLHNIMEEILNSIRGGVKIKDVYLKARKMAEEEGYGDYFQGYGAQQGEYIGHGLGLEVDEPPVITPYEEQEFREGMTLAVEPKFIIPQWGAVDLEETLCVRKDGCQVFSPVRRKLYEVS